MKTLSTLLFTTLLMACASMQADAPYSGPIEPTCSGTTEECADLWYAYGDTTGDYGVIDL